MEWLWVHRLAPLQPTSLLNIMKKSCFLRYPNLPCISGMSMTLLSSFKMKFLIRLNGLHSSLQFSFEKEKNNSLPFLDVHVEHTKVSYETKVYCKPWFTRESFTRLKRKASLVSTLVHCALKICSKSKLKEEINRIKEILLDNGYPEDFVLKQISKKITQFSRPKQFGPDKCPFYLWVTYTGKAALTLERKLQIAVENCYGSMALRTVFVSRQMLPASWKDVLPAIQKSSVIYEYKCHCDSGYVGKTAQRLQDHIKQHVLNHYDNTQPLNECKGKQPIAECDSAIGQHLLENDQCAAN